MELNEPNNDFDFSQLKLSLPTIIQGGAYFTKYLYNSKPLYIQTPRSTTKQGFLKNGKKYHSDLMFDNTAESFINWIEKLEEHSQQLIFSNADKWFQNELSLNDIEEAFNTTIKVYKSGTYYLIRVYSKISSVTQQPVVKIYDEYEKLVSIKEITNKTNVLSILEFQGIKFTSRSFQIEIEVKQMMVVKEEDAIFESCLIKKTNSNNISLVNVDVLDTATNKQQLVESQEHVEPPQNIDNIFSKNILEEEEENDVGEDIYRKLNIENLDTNSVVEPLSESIIESKEVKEVKVENVEAKEDVENVKTKEEEDVLSILKVEDLDEDLNEDLNEEIESKNRKESVNAYIDTNNNNNNINNTPNMIVEGLELESPPQVKLQLVDVDILEEKEKEQYDLDKLVIEDLEQELDMDIDIEEVKVSDSEIPLESITLKNPNQVYFDLYKEAKKKAKEAKKNALLAYLELKNIKKTYMLNDINDSDSDVTSETSESDL